MREQLANTPPSVELRLNDMQRELGVLCVTGSDVYRQAFREATAEALDDPDVRSLVGCALDFRPELTTSRAINLHERAVLPSELKRDMSFPRRLQPTTEDMLQVYTRLVETEMYPETYLGNMMRNPISCVADRGKLIKLIAALEGINYPLRIKEVGASQNHILKKLALSSKPALPYGETTVLSDGKPDIAQSKRLMQLLNTRYLSLGLSTGVDLERIDDPATQNWADACSFYLGERLDTLKVDEYALLTDVSPKQVSFFQDDYSDFDEERFAHELPQAQQYDYVVFPTMLYQQTPQQIRKMFETAKKYLDPNGARRLIAIDFINYLDMNGAIDKQDDRWTSYNTFVADPFGDDPVFKHYFSCPGPDPGRAKQISFEPAARELISANKIRLLQGAPYRPKV